MKKVSLTTFAIKFLMPEPVDWRTSFYFQSTVLKHMGKRIHAFCFVLFLKCFLMMYTKLLIKM